MKLIGRGKIFFLEIRDISLQAIIIYSLYFIKYFFKHFTFKFLLSFIRVFINSDRIYLTKHENSNLFEIISSDLKELAAFPIFDFWCS